MNYRGITGFDTLPCVPADPRIIPYFQQTIQLRFKTLSHAPVQLTVSDGQNSHWTNCCWLASYSARKIHTIYSSIAWLLLYGYQIYRWAQNGNILACWWFQTCYGMSSLPLTFIFFKMVKTTNQLQYILQYR